MKTKKLHIGLERIDNQSNSFFRNGTFNWKKSEDEVWAELEKKLVNQPATRKLKPRFFTYAAASVILVLGLTSFFRFYTVTEKTNPGEHKTVGLPDGTNVELNASTTLKYNPLWWKISRNARLTGEGFFEVAKGKRFQVISPNGTTEVLGTEFNVYARENLYRVTCLTGKIKVTSPASKTVFLSPNCKAEVNPDGNISVFQNIDTYPEISWKKNIFLFTTAPIEFVFNEIERQYNIKIQYSLDISTLFYSGNFSKESRVEEVLGYICPAMGFKYIKLKEGVFEISAVN